MASAIEKSKPIRKNKIVFMGPSQKKFNSLNEQATYFLNTYWRNWNNYTDPRSCILPPIFKYKRPEISDEAFENFQMTQTSTKPKNLITARISDEAEYLVYSAIQQLIQDKVQAPFIAVRNLDLRLNYDANMQLHGSLIKLFPDLQWNKFLDIMKESFSKETPNTEFDFVLIGQKFGIVVIEVKSSSYGQQKYFKPQDKSLPDSYEHGINQLQAVNALIYLLQETTKTSTSKHASKKLQHACVQKIIFTPNLEGTKFNQWFKNLDKCSQVYVIEKIDDVVQWFREDIDIFGTEEKSLYYKLREILQSGTKMLPDTYEAYCPIIAAIASTTLLSSTKGSSFIEMDKLRFSELEAGLREHSRIINQNPLKNQSSKLAACSSLVKASKQIKNFSRVIFLTSDQQKAFQGPCRQLIIGTAGTGKTVVLQAKALECLEKGESVAVLAQKFFMERYETLFRNYGFERFKVYDWFEILYDIKCEFIDDDSFRMSAENFFNQLLSYVEKNTLSDTYSWLLNFDNIFIDDAQDTASVGSSWIRVTLGAVTATMALSQMTCPSKIVWAAVDPMSSDLQTVADRFLENAIDWNRKLNEKYFHPTVLNQVMRCSENIFNAAYKSLIPEYISFHYSPVIGHKIRGVTVTAIHEHFSTSAKARTALREKIKPYITDFYRQNFDLNSLAIVMHDEDNQPSRENLHDFVVRYCEQEFSRLRPNLHENQANKPATRNWHDVSSVEWPAVIFASCAPLIRHKLRRYARYRAMTRATSILIDITVTYGEEIEYLDTLPKTSANVSEYVEVVRREDETFNPDFDSSSILSITKVDEISNRNSDSTSIVVSMGEKSSKKQKRPIAYNVNCCCAEFRIEKPRCKIRLPCCDCEIRPRRCEIL